MKFTFALLTSLLLLLGCSKENNADKSLQEIKRLTHESNYDVAIIKAKNILKNNANDINVRLLLANSYRLRGSFVNAEKEFDMAIKKGASITSFLPSYLEVLYAQHDFNHIISTWDKYKDLIDINDKIKSAFIVSLAAIIC